MASEKVANGLSPFKKQLRSKHNRTFIVPSVFGLVFGALVLVLLMMALGYANNLLYLFVFFLVSVAVNSMFVTNQNVDRAKMISVQASAGFTGEELALNVVVRNQKKDPSFRLELKADSRVAVCDEVNGFSEVVVKVPWIPKRRGTQRLPTVSLRSTFPFGLLMAWKYFEDSKNVTIYPERKGASEFPSNSVQSQIGGEVGLFKELRPFQSSDSPLRIDWRASAKHQTHLVKTFQEQSDKNIHLSWEQTNHLSNVENRLSQLSLWIWQAERLQVPYSVEIGDFRMPALLGYSHFHSCMSYLANYRSEEQI